MTDYYNGGLSLSFRKNLQSKEILGGTHHWFMNQALKEAYKAYKKDETPIGAIVVRDGEIISRGHNEKELKNDPTIHAEMSAIRKASRKLGTWHLDDCDMYVTLEPCAMCAGAIIHARIKRLFIGAADLKAGAAGSVINVLEHGLLNHDVEVIYGILEDECSQVLKDFFKELRIRKQKK